MAQTSQWLRSNFKHETSDNRLGTCRVRPNATESKISDLLLRIGWRRHVSTKNSRIVMEPCVEFKMTVGWQPRTSSCFEEMAMFRGDEDTFESVFDKIVSFASVKHSLTLDDTPVRAGTGKDPNIVDVGALNRGGKSKCGKGYKYHLLGFAIQKVCRFILF